jgi:hypothetical protein
MLFSADGTPAPASNRGADQTLFIRRIALRPALRYFGRPSFDVTDNDPTFFERLSATISRSPSPSPQASWLVEDEDNTLSLTAAEAGLDIEAEVPVQGEALGTVTEDVGGSDDRSRP